MENAYCGPAPLAGAIFSAWNLDPILLAVLALAFWLLRKARGAARWGMALVALAYVSPICALSAGLFSARAVHHLVIVFGAAPLLACGMGERRHLPLASALALNVFVFWAWHWPAAYQWALSSHLAYWLGQVALMGSSVLFWNALYRRGTSLPAGIPAVIAMVMQMGLLGAIITFAPQALYAPHFTTAALYGVSALEDQQLAGLLMWTASVPLTLAAAYPVLRHWLSPSRQEAPG